MPQERPYSPVDGIWLKDDFYSNDPVTDGLVGELHWEIAALGNASTIAYQTARAYGTIKDTTAATADGDGEVYRLFTDGLVLNNKGGGFVFRCKLNDQIASNNFRIGVDDSVTATSPTEGIWVDCDGGVLSLQVDSADHGDLSQLVENVSTLTTGTTMVVDTWHDFLVTWTGDNGRGGPKWVECYVDGEIGASCYSNIDDDEEVECKIIHWQDSGGALAVELEIDYYEFWQYR
jgi:hypothetical protein